VGFLKKIEEKIVYRSEQCNIPIPVISKVKNLSKFFLAIGRSRKGDLREDWEIRQIPALKMTTKK
jgi:hypothetical protein